MRGGTRVGGLPQRRTSCLASHRPVGYAGSVNILAFEGLAAKCAEGAIATKVVHAPRRFPEWSRASTPTVRYASLLAGRWRTSRWDTGAGADTSVCSGGRWKRALLRW